MGNWKTGAQRPAKTRGPERSSRNANKGQVGNSPLGWLRVGSGWCSGGARRQDVRLRLAGAVASLA